MRYHLVINRFSPDALRQAEELNGFKRLLPEEMEEGEALLICGEPAAGPEEEGIPAAQVRRILMEEYDAENALGVLCGWMEEEDLYIWANGGPENELAVRAACRRQGTSLADVSRVSLADNGLLPGDELLAVGGLLAEKMVYANHMKASFHMGRGPYCITLEKGVEKLPVEGGLARVTAEKICGGRPSHILSREWIPKEQESGLENAKLVIVGGRGCGGRQTVEKLGNIAETLGGQLGISRPAAMNAWASMDKMMGVSGAMIGPDICIAAGVSGAAAFYAGIEKSRLIIAINRDERAPIMKKADVAIADDLRPVLEELAAIAQQKDSV